MKSIILHVDSIVVDRYIMTILQLLLTRLQQDDRDRCDLCHKTLSFLGLLAGKHGGKSLQKSIVKISKPAFSLILSYMSSCTLKLHSQILQIRSMPKLLLLEPHEFFVRHLTFLLIRGDPASWRALGAILVKSVDSWASYTRMKALSVQKRFQMVPWPATMLLFSKLHFGSKKVEDAFSDIHDVKEFASFHLHQLATQRPHFQPLVSTIQEQ